MKIFVSYSRSDTGDFAEQIQKHFRNFKHYDVFTDVNNINAGEDWSETIEKNISKRDIFVIIITYGSLQSTHVRDEILQAQREHKRIIPCFHKDVGEGDITWGLSKIQGVEFTEKYELARDLYSEILRPQTGSKKDISGIFTLPSIPSTGTKEDPKYTKVQESKENATPSNPYAPRFKGAYSPVQTKKKQGSKLKIVALIIGVAAVIAALMAFSFPASTKQPFHFPTLPGLELNAPKTSPENGDTDPLLTTPANPTFASGYDHGCDDAKISDPSDRYINQPEKGPSYHSAEFMRAYNEGYNKCSNDGSGLSDLFK